MLCLVLAPAEHRYMRATLDVKVASEGTRGVQPHDTLTGRPAFVSSVIGQHVVAQCGAATPAVSSA